VRARIEILKDLVTLKSDSRQLEKKLAQYPWDMDEPLLILHKEDVIAVVQRCLNKEISFKDLNDWADVIELRDDIDFEDEEVKQLIFELANPEINGALTLERLKTIINHR